MKPGCDLYHVLYKIPYLLKAPAVSTIPTTATNGTKIDAPSSSSVAVGQVGVAAAVIDTSKPVDVPPPLETFLQYVADAADR